MVIVIAEEDLRVDIYRDGMGKPSVRLLHLPTRLVESCGEHDTQRENYDSALNALHRRLVSNALQALSST
jgi:protein subunit release factor A